MHLFIDLVMNLVALQSRSWDDNMSGLHSSFLGSMFKPVDELSDDEAEGPKSPQVQKKPAAAGAKAKAAPKATPKKTIPSDTPKKRPAVATLDSPMKRPAAAKPKDKETSIGKCFYKATGIYGFKIDGSQKMTATR